MKFTKMHGIGNDYIYIYQEEQLNLSEFAKHYSTPHVGIGSDGVIHICKASPPSDFKMEMYNADGSRGKMCGNGIRCVGKYLYDKKLTTKTTLTIETDAGLRDLQLQLDERNQVARVTVAMGTAANMEEKHIQVEGLSLTGTYVTIGNPHFVIECGNPSHIPVEIWGKQIEQHPIFAPEGVNVEFYRPTWAGFEFRVWERGSGETQACGTGACACYAVGQSHGRLRQGHNVAKLLGGELELWEEHGEIFLSGTATTVFEGEIPFSTNTINVRDSFGNFPPEPS